MCYLHSPQQMLFSLLQFLASLFQIIVSPKAAGSMIPLKNKRWYFNAEKKRMHYWLKGIGRFNIVCREFLFKKKLFIMKANGVFLLFKGLSSR